MSPSWHFQIARPGDRVRNPSVAEFFADEAIANPGHALVREAIQNAIDARPPSARIVKAPVRVRMLISESKNAISPHRSMTYAAGMWEHVRSPDTGVRRPPRPDEPCSFLVIEDFGTTGLTGDPLQLHPNADTPNAFFHFFRAEGLTDKLPGAGGSKGIGKNVFPRMSRVNCMLALTRRVDDDRRLLMGTMILPPHRLNGEHYTPDAWFGDLRTDNIVAPIEDQRLLDQFTNDFHLARTTEPGLSIVVPWIDDAELSAPTLISEIVQEWFYPIMSGILEVVVESADLYCELNARNFMECLHGCDTDTQEQLSPFVALAASCLSADRHTLPRVETAGPNERPDWNIARIDDDAIGRLRAELESGRPVTVIAPVSIQPIGEALKQSHLVVSLQRCEGSGAGRVRFIRDAISIPHSAYQRPSGYAALVIADDPALADLLRDAEHPAHTHWSKDTATFRDKYEWGSSCLTFVRNAAARTLALLRHDETLEDPDLLNDLFSIPMVDAADDQVPVRRAKRMMRDRPETDADGVPPIATKPRRYQITKHAGGFTISNTPTPAKPPFRLRVLVAYDARARGARSPLRDWNEADFRLGHDGVRLSGEAKGCSIVEMADNRLVFDVLEPEFCVSICGFDERRDLLVDGRIVEVDDAAAI